MSRMGNQPVELASGVELDVSGQEVSVKGPKGSLRCALPPGIELEEAEGKAVLKRTNESRQTKADHGLARSLLQGMVTGVSTGFRRELDIQGVGYRGQLKGKLLSLSLGFSHPVEYEVPEGVSLTMPDTTTIILEGIDKQLVGQTAATIRRFKPPDAYKGKGIRYAGEEISLKEGKTVA